MLTLLLVLGVLLLTAVAFFLIVGEKGELHPTTWAFVRESGMHLRTLHGCIYLRWTQQYINALFGMTARNLTASKGEHWLAQHYHAKVLTQEHARCIIKLEQPIERRNLDQIVPYSIAHDFILQASPDIAVYECVCRNARAAHCEPTQVCMVVGRPFADFVLEHHPDKSHRLSREEALQLLEAEHLRGHVHSAGFKDAMLNRFYAICHCCKCCCGGIREMAERGVPRVASSGYVARIDPAACALCEDCIEACPFHAISKNGDTVIYDWERCLGCGVCEVMCKVGAITMVLDERKGVPVDVRMLA